MTDQGVMNRGALRCIRDLVLALAAVTALVAPASEASAQNVDTLFSNESLMPNEWLMSSNGGFQLIMQGDGNLVLYRLADMKALWNSRTAGNPGAFAVMQGDGNLVVYRDGKPLFNTQTQGNPGSRLTMQGDGNLVIYSPTDQPLFASRTVQRLPPPTMPAKDTLQANETLLPNESLTSLSGKFLFIMQGDGNLVLYRVDDAKPIWNSRTAGNPGAFAVMQGDGNFVVYLDNKPLFNTGTQGNPGARIVVQNDGNLVVFSSDDKPLFSTKRRPPVCETELRAVFGGGIEDGRFLRAGTRCRVIIPLTLSPVFIVPFFSPFSPVVDFCFGNTTFRGVQEVQVCR